jgi:hypothetical protein
MEVNTSTMNETKRQLLEGVLARTDDTNRLGDFGNSNLLELRTAPTLS